MNRMNIKTVILFGAVVVAGGFLVFAVNAATQAITFGSDDIAADTSMIVVDANAESGSYVRFSDQPEPTPEPTVALTPTVTPEPTTAPVLNDGLHAYCSQNTIIAVDGTSAIPANGAFTKIATLNVGGFANLEGPVVYNGDLYVSRLGQSLTGGELYRLDGSTLTPVADVSAGVNGMAVSIEKGLEQHLFGARHADGSISKITIDGDAVSFSPHVSGFNNARFNSPNDIAIFSDGGIVFTDPSWQTASPTQPSERAYFIEPNGAVSALQSGPTRPNGVIADASQQKLFVGGTDGIFEYTITSLIEGGATFSAPTKILNGAHTDGMTADCYGNVYFTVDKTVVVYSTSESKVLQTYQVPDGLTGANLAFMDSSLILTTFGTNPSIYALEMGDAAFVGFPN